MRTTVGIAIWAALIGGGVWAATAGPAARPLERLSAFVSAPAHRVTVVLPARPDAEVGGLVMTPDADRFLRRVGRIAATRSDGDGLALDLDLYPDAVARWPHAIDATFVTVPATAEWIVRTLLPPERVASIRDRWQTFYDAERAAIAESLWPVVRASLEELLHFYEREIPRVVSNHADGFRRLVDTHRGGAFEKQLMPAVQEVAWRVGQREFAPLLGEIGRDLWARLPVMGLGVRYAFEFVPFVEEGQVAERFKRYLDEDAMPILRARSAEIVAVLGVVARETMRDDRVVAAFRAMVGEVLEDPEFYRLLRDVAADLTVRNERLQELLREQWRERGLREAVEQVTTKLEPLIKEVVNSIALSPDGKRINARLNQVLRSRVLKKDVAWVLLEPRDVGEPPAAGSSIVGRIRD